jgi:ABC-2 type transport system ATP-binding protein
MPGSPLVSVTDLTRRFDGRVAIERVSFELRRGEILALLGPNGAGKTTTMRLMAGLLRPDEGRVEIEGLALTKHASPALRARIGFLTETPGLWDRLSVEANLLTYARLYGVSDPVERVTVALERFDLLDRRADAAATLSKGMKQKVALARALLHDPAVVLLDEPTAGLDPAVARSVRQLVVALRDEGRGVLVSTHNLDEAERVADRVAVLRQRLLAVETPDALRRTLFGTRVRVELTAAADAFAPAVRQVVGSEVTVAGRTISCALERPEEQIPALVRALAVAGAPVRSVVEEQAHLEDVYMALVKED